VCYVVALICLVIHAVWRKWHGTLKYSLIMIIIIIIIKHVVCTVCVCLDGGVGCFGGKKKSPGGKDSKSRSRSLFLSSHFYFVNASSVVICLLHVCVA